MRLITITLHFRKWETTCIDTANNFIEMFGGYYFEMWREPYEGKEINYIKSLGLPFKTTEQKHGK